MVEHLPSKQAVASSSLVSRSFLFPGPRAQRQSARLITGGSLVRIQLGPPPASRQPLGDGLINLLRQRCTLLP